MSNFELLPAIDLRAGRVVRLRQGRFDRETVYGEDPARVASGFAEAGARWLHVVDLDGARVGRPVHFRQIRAIVDAAGERAAVEVAGGLRDARSADGALAAGAARVVLGTAALRNPSLVTRLVERHGPTRVAIALDVRDGRAHGDAWRPGVAGAPVGEALDRLAAAGATTFEVTAIDRDGLLAGPDLALLAALVGQGRGRIIASAGISSLDDLLAVRALGCVGAIVGRAIYEGQLDLASAIAHLASAPRPPGVRR